MMATASFIGSEPTFLMVIGGLHKFMMMPMGTEASIYDVIVHRTKLVSATTTQKRKTKQTGTRLFRTHTAIFILG